MRRQRHLSAVRDACRCIRRWTVPVASDYLFESRVIGCIRKNRDDLDAIVRALDPAGTARKTRVDARGRAAAPAPVGELDRETGTLEELIAVGDGESLAPKVGNDL